MSVPRSQAHDKKSEVNQEELLQRRFRAKCRFRALVRMVLANLYWMENEPPEYEGIDNVKRRVEQAMRGKPKKKQLLSLRDKALLNKPAHERTESEKRYIYRIIGGLKCFKRYPNNVKRKLAAVTYFKYYGPGRVIVREKQEAYALYFIVTGDITISLMVYDELLQQQISLELGQMHQGDMFGEVSLLHNIPRTATCTTVGDCELLALMKDDFKNVLQASLQKQWDEVQEAMSSFSYFENLDQVSKREGCIVAKMKSFDPDEVILGDGCGVPNFVYFVLSGICQLIESLEVIATKFPLRTCYTLYDPFVKVESSESEDIEKKYFPTTSKMTSSFLKPPSVIMKSKMKITSSTSEEIEKPHFSAHSSTSKKKGSVLKSASKMMTSKDNMRPGSVATESVVRDKPGTLSVGSLKSGKSNKQSSLITIKRMTSTIQLPEHTNDNNSRSVQPSENMRETLAIMEEKDKGPVRTTYFMQVCLFKAGSTFGFGENMRDRRIVALDRVDCMLMPKVWLLQKNTANIWSRIQHYLEKKLPTKKQLFEDFVQQRRWLEYRDQLVHDVVKRSKTVNYTTVHDVPYSIRMEEMLDM